MPDYGGLTSLSEAVGSGFQGLMGIRKQNQEEQAKKDAVARALQERQQDLFLKGAVENPDAPGGLEYTPEVKAQKAHEAGRIDPNSTQSKLYRGLGKQVGLPLEGGESAGDIEQILPAFEKHQDAQARNAGLSEQRAGRLAGEKEKKSSKLAESLQNDLDPNKARGGNLAKTQASINSADRVDAIFKQYPDYNIPKNQTAELSSALAGLISGGSAQSQHQIDTLTPSTLGGNVADITSWVTGNPQGREQQAFMRAMHDTALRERQVAQDQVRQAQLQRLGRYEGFKKENPEEFNRIVGNYGLLDENNNVVQMPRNAGLLKGQQPQGLLQAPGMAQGGVDPDAAKYAQMHNLPIEQASAIIQSRKGQANAR